MNKLWIATDKDQLTYMFKSKPFRTTVNTWDVIGKYDAKYISERVCEFLIDKVLTWKDEPVEVTINF
jgi:hypothetical protein